MQDDTVFLLTVPHATCPAKPDPRDPNIHPCDTAAKGAAIALAHYLLPHRRRVFVCSTPRFPKDANRVTGALLPMRRAHRRALAEHARTMTLDVHSFPVGMPARDNDLHFMDDHPFQPWVAAFVAEVAKRLPRLRVEFMAGSHMNDIVGETKLHGRPAILVEVSEGLGRDDVNGAMKAIADVAFEFANTRRV